MMTMLFTKKTCMDFLRKFVALVLVLAVLQYHQVGARFVVEKNSITVLSPSNLRHQKHDGAIGNFGVPDYGGRKEVFVVGTESGHVFLPIVAPRWALIGGGCHRYSAPSIPIRICARGAERGV